MNEIENWHLEPIESNYVLEGFRPLTIQERLEVYVKLTKKQRELIDAHRKYLIRSEFLKDSYLNASDWEFVDLKIDDYYPETHPKNKMLYCQCGRRLKYQYVVKSKATGKTMGLGIQHFKDHLNIPQQVATEIVQRLNNVDFALDELLWLKRRNIDFPENLWTHYTLAFYQNQFLDQSIPFNNELAQRFADFKEADMPIYLSDFTLLVKEIQRLSTNTNSITNELFNETYFNQFKSQFTRDIREETLFNQMSIWSTQIQQRLITHSEKPKLPISFFEELFQILEKDQDKREKEILHFANKGMGKWLQKEVYLHLIRKQALYGLTSEFLSQIHPFMREGLAAFISNETNTKEIAESVDQIEKILADYDEETRERILMTLKEKIAE